MKITIVSGSQRANSQSLSVARYLESLSLDHFDTTN
nr:NADPH-dependent oxidoreductase [Vibrio anguillarum]